MRNHFCIECRLGLFTVLILALLAAIGSVRAEEQLVTSGQDGRTLSWITTTADHKGVFRIDCVDGYALFASLTLMSGSLAPSSAAVAGTLAARTRWITGNAMPMPVNSIYAMTPADLLTQAGSSTDRKLQFDTDSRSVRRISFGTEKLDDFIRRAPAPCR